MFIRKNITPILVTFITAFFSIWLFSLYLHGPLRGQNQWAFLTSKMFGIPSALEKKGITPFLTGKECGWDGQFYYFIANSLLPSSDTAKHIDSPSYRYQRIGLPLTANLVSKLFFQDWVSPTTYQLTYFTLILLAAFTLAKLFQRYAISPWFALFWSLSSGVNLTLFSGLPDAAAQAYFIFALFFYLDKRWIAYSLLMTMAILCREAYVILAATLFFLQAYHDIKEKKSWFFWKSDYKKYLSFIFPGLIFIIWQAYITIHFKRTPSSEGHGLINYPFLLWLYFSLKYGSFYFYHQIAHSLFPHHFNDYDPNSKPYYLQQIFGLFSYIILVISGGVLSIKAFLTYRRDDVLKSSVALMCAIYIFLITCFGPTQMTDTTGYLKVINFIFIIIPLFYAWLGRKMSMKMILLFLIILVVGNYIFYLRIR